MDFNGACVKGVCRTAVAQGAAKSTAALAAAPSAEKKAGRTSEIRKGFPKNYCSVVLRARTNTQAQGG